MRSSGRGLVAVLGALVIAFLGVGGLAAQPASAAPDPGSVGTRTFTWFLCADGEQTWTVPANVFVVQAEVVGGQGYPAVSASGGGHGGAVTAQFKVHPGDVYDIEPGCAGAEDDGGHGWASGGSGAHSSSHSGNGHGGGGASAIEQVVGNATKLLLVGGGGGGAADSSHDHCCVGGGDGGHPAQSGSAGKGFSGGRGGGGGAAPGPNGVSGEHANAIEGGAGGGGGGGYPFGGVGGHKGGNISSSGGGGGGGDSYADTTLTIDPKYSTSSTTGDGFVKLTWSPVAHRLAIRAGSNQQAVISRPFAQQLSVQALGSADDPITGINVTFTLPSSGASGTFAGGKRSVTVTTGNDGVATAPQVTADHTAGSWQAKATVTGGAEPAVFELKNLPAATTTAVSSSANPSKTDESVRFTATVRATTASAGVPTGAVQFTVDGHSLGAPVALDAKGVAISAPVSDLDAGTHKVSAEYTGSADFAPSTGTLTQTVGVASTPLTPVNPSGATLANTGTPLGGLLLLAALALIGGVALMLATRTKRHRRRRRA